MAVDPGQGGVDQRLVSVFNRVIVQQLKQVHDRVDAASIGRGEQLKRLRLEFAFDQGIQQALIMR